jgi:phage-related protein
VGTGLDDIAEARTRIQARTGETLPLTPGQVTDEPLVQSTQGQLVRRSDGAAIRDTYAEQQRIMGEFESSVKAPFLAPRRDEPIDIVGRDIQAKARKAPNKGIATVEAQTEEARVAALNAAELATRGEMSPTLANQMAREELQTGRDMVQAQFGRDYARINEMAGGAKVDLEPFRQVAKKWDKEIKRDILPLLTEEDGKLFSTAAKAYTKEVEGLEFGAENILTPVTKLVSEPASFGAVQRTLSALRREIRLAKKGVGARTDFKALDELREALIISRDRALRGRPELQRQIDNVEASYARARRLVDRSLVGDILRKVEGGGYSLRDEFVIDRILTRPSGAKQVAQVLNDPEYSSFKEGLGPIRAGILGKYRKDVIDPDTGIAIPAKHVTWMGQRRESLKHFFSEDEIARLDKSRDAAVMYRDITKRNEQVVKKINQSFAMKLNNWDSTEVLQKTFKPQAVNNVRRLKRILGDTSPEWQSYQAAAMRKLWSDHSSWDKAAATFKLDEKKLAKLMESQDEIGLLQATFGKDLVDDMRTITTALTAANRKPAATMSDYVNEITGRQQTALNSLLRVYYAPLSLRGRMLTAGVRLRGKAAERALIRAFSDAEEFRRLAQLAKVKPGSKKARIILGGMGATILGFNPPSDEIEP